MLLSKILFFIELILVTCFVLFYFIVNLDVIVNFSLDYLRSTDVFVLHCFVLMLFNVLFNDSFMPFIWFNLGIDVIALFIAVLLIIH